MKDLKAFINKDVLKRIRHNRDHADILCVAASDEEAKDELEIRFGYHRYSWNTSEVLLVKLDPNDLERTIKETIDYLNEVKGYMKYFGWWIGSINARNMQEAEKMLDSCKSGSLSKVVNWISGTTKNI